LTLLVNNRTRRRRRIWNA